MDIRPYRPGDEEARVAIFNREAGPLPKFKSATVEEVTRRERATGADPTASFCAVHDGAIVGYAVLNPYGRISYPWCLPGTAEAVRVALLDAVLEALRVRGVAEAWAAYRRDWTPVREFLGRNGFEESRAMINYVAELDRMPRDPVPEGLAIEPLERAEFGTVLGWHQGVLSADAPVPIVEFFYENPYFGPECLFRLRQLADDTVRGVALLIGNAGFADPAQVDADMPCFRLGTFGTERERHKRFNGVVSCLFEDEAAGRLLLAEAARRLETAGLRRIAAQASTDQGALVAFYDRFFTRQGSFPIVSKRLIP